MIPNDVMKIFLDVASHRIVLNAKARAGHVTAETILTQVLEQTDVQAKDSARQIRSGNFQMR